MTKQAIIERTIEAIQKLPEAKAEEISDFADFLIRKYEDEILNKEIAEVALKGKTYSFLEEEPEVYSVKDIKKKIG